MEHEFVACVKTPMGEDFFVVPEAFLGTMVHWVDLDPLVDEEWRDYELYVPELQDVEHYEECECVELSEEQCA